MANKEITIESYIADGLTKIYVCFDRDYFWQKAKIKVYNSNNELAYEEESSDLGVNFEPRFSLEDKPKIYNINGNSKTGIFTVYAYLSGELVGKKQFEYTLYPCQYTLPTLEMTLTSTSQLNGYNAVGVTALQAAFSGSAKNGATISSYNLSLEGKNYGAPYKSDVLTQDGWMTVTGEVTDSRGFTAEVSQKIWVIANMPSLDSVKGSTKYLDRAINYDFTPPSDDAYSKLLIESLVGSTYQAITTLNLGQTNGKTTKSYSFNEEQLKTIYERYPTSSTVPLRFTLLSYKDAYTTQLKEQYSKEISLEIPENSATKPTISSILCEGVPAILGSGDVYVKGKNGVKVTATGDGKYKASIARIVWSVENETFENKSASDYFNMYGNLTIKVIATDSRGFIGEDTKTIRVYDYSKPYISPITNAERIVVKRALKNGSISDSGEYLRIEAGRRYSKIGGINRCTLNYRKKGRGEKKWGDDKVLLSTTVSDDDYSGTINEGLDVQNIYYIELSVVDSFGEIDSVVFPISTEKAYMDRSGTRNSIAFGGHVIEDNAFEVYQTAYFRGGMYFDDLETDARYQISIEDGKLVAKQVNTTFSLRR